MAPEDTLMFSTAKSPVRGRLPERYVSSVKKARESLGLDSWIRLDEALGRPIKWNQMINKGNDGQW